MKEQERIIEIRGLIEKHISKIDYQSDRYDTKVVTHTYGGKSITVMFDHHEFASINIMTGQNALPTFTLRQTENDWYKRTFQRITFSVSITDTDSAIKRVLCNYIPISKAKDVRLISAELDRQGLGYDKICYDTQRKKYVIIGKQNAFEPYLPEASGTYTHRPTRFGKYMPLSTYLQMLENRTYRMNSIVSMNDTSESFVINDFVSGQNLTDETAYYSEVVANKNMLIVSLCAKVDDAEMWRLYGDNGQGVCLVFTVNSNDLQPIVYLNESDRSAFSVFRETILSLRDKHIDIYFEDFEKKRCFFKSSQFKYEDEYRLIYRCPDEELKMTHYGSLISMYRDFDISSDEFGKLGIMPKQLIIGANLPHSDVNYPLLDSLSRERLGIESIVWSKVDKIRV